MAINLSSNDNQSVAIKRKWKSAFLLVAAIGFIGHSFAIIKYYFQYHATANIENKKSPSSVTPSFTICRQIPEPNENCTEERIQRLIERLNSINKQHEVIASEYEKYKQ